MVAKNVCEILKNHTTLEVEQIDRLYLNGYIPRLQAPGMFAYFVREILGMPVVSTAVVSEMTRDFVRRIERFAKDEEAELVKFSRKQRKDDLTQAKLASFQGQEGILYIGKAQRCHGASCPQSGRTHGKVVAKDRPTWVGPPGPTVTIRWR